MSHRLVKDLFLKYKKNFQGSKYKQLVKKWAKEVNQHFKENMQMANEHIKYLTSLVIRNIKLKQWNTTTYQFKCLKSGGKGIWSYEVFVGIWRNCNAYTFLVGV